MYVCTGIIDSTSDAIFHALDPCEGDVYLHHPNFDLLLGNVQNILV